MATELASQASTVDDLSALLRGLLKSALQRMLESEMDAHLKRKDSPLPFEPPAPNNRRNGRSKKTVHGELGEIPIAVPRDRDGTFEPVIVGKYQRRLAGFDEKILALYAKGLSTRDIQDVVAELHGVEVSATLISEVTAGLDEEVSAWRSRRLDAVWPIVYFDGIVVHVRGEGGRVSQHTMYVALGVNLQGKKELLGLWLNQTEGAKSWLSCLTDLKNRGLTDVFVACVDGLSGFPEAIRAAYPQAKVQLCAVHLVRAALKYVTDEDSKEVVKDLKGVYQAPTAQEAEAALDRFAEKWDSKHPTISKQWRLRWADLIATFEFPPEIRKAIHDQRDRECQQRDPQVHAQPQAVPQRRQRGEADLAGHQRGGQEVDDAHHRLEAGPEPLRHPLRGPHARQA
jgi:putative transposase